MRHQYLALVALTGSLTVTACHDTTQPSRADARKARASSLGMPPSSGAHRNIDEHFAAIAAQIPGFGGAFLGADGLTHVYLIRRGANVETRVRSLLPVRLAGRPIQVRQGVYDYRDLKHWKEVSRQVLTVPGVVYTDVDEATNRVVIGVLNEGIGVNLRQILATLGVPSDAVVIRRAARVRQLQSLRAQYDTLVGALGIEVDNLTYNVSSGCTFGVVVEDTAGLRYGITNSHCTGPTPGAFGVNDGARIYQGTRQIGTEVSDPGFWTGTDVFGTVCPTSRRCRYSDAAAFSLIRPSVLTQVANTPIGTNLRTYPNITLQYRSDQGFANQMGFPVFGDTVVAVGSYTGKQRGIVIRSCVDQVVFDDLDNDTGITLICQYDADGAAGIVGDSGGPVMWVEAGTGRNVIGGLLWGGGNDPDTNAPFISFSYWWYVNIEVASDIQPAPGIFYYSAP